MIVLDTNVVSELMRPQPTPKVADWLQQQQQDSLALTSITSAELLYGIRRLPPGIRRRQLELGLQSFMERGFRSRVLPFDDSAADAYSGIVVDRRRAGRPIDAFDAMIAGIALTRNAEVATRDVAGFEGCGVRILNPWD